jgi:hypothetical protein
MRLNHRQLQTGAKAARHARQDLWWCSGGLT